jgi:hypothetical protein
VNTNPYNIPNDGVTSADAALLAAVNSIAGIVPAVTPHRYGRGGTLQLPTGEILTKHLDLDPVVKLAGNGSISSTIMLQDHAGITADGEMITVLPDLDPENAIAAQNILDGFTIYGGRDTAPALAHGKALTGIRWTTAPKRASSLQNVQVVGTTGHGLVMEDGRDQIRGFNFKILNNKKWGMKATNITDFKITQIGIGRNDWGGLWLDSCASANISQFDIWSPDAFAGDPETATAYVLRIENSGKTAFSDGTVEGTTFISGSNEAGGATPHVKRERRYDAFYNVTFKVKGGSVVRPLSLIDIEDIDAVLFNQCPIIYPHKGPDAADLAGTPDYIWAHFNRQNTADMSEVTLNGQDIFQISSSVAQGIPPIVPFRKHWSNKPERCRWINGPGTLIDIANGNLGPQFVAANGATLQTAYYPLLYLALNPGTLLDAAPSTFVVPNVAARAAGCTACFIHY